MDNRRVSYPLMSGGRFANSLFEAAATLGLARKRGVQPAFPADYPYRRWLSMPDDWFVGDLGNTVPAVSLARNLPAAMRPYLQDLRLWSDVTDEVRAAFSPSAEAREILDRIWAAEFAHLPSPLCAVHVRRGDTITRNPPDTIQPLPADYFTRAVANWQPATVCVFTDDPVWCAENLPVEWVVYQGDPGPEDIDADYLTRPRMDWVDLMLMSRIAGSEAGKIVISNSSFSWWSAWLSGTDNVAFPGRWFGAKLLRRGFDVSLILSDRWTRIETV